MTGADVTTYASGGADTNTWQSRSNCLPALLNDPAHELYVLCLGINDRTYVTKGTIADIKEDYTENPNTFYGNYGKIIAQIKENAPNAKILISKVFIVTLQTGAYYQWSSEAIEEIANHFNIPYIDTADADFFSSGWFDNNMRRGHPIAPTYAGIAKAMKYLISKCILENTSYFADYYPN
jgi:lysophospholipase L1-like esterase